MSSTSTTCFFSFGPDESYILRSHEGLRYRNLPPNLHQLILAGNVVEVHWAALGPVKESWALSFEDREGKNNLGWGNDIPQDLQRILPTLTPTPHLRVFLGRRDSFIAWDATFIRWTGLPLGLEAGLQSWLTPAGWKAGPPRIVTWGPSSAYFAVSEYGKVGFGIGPGDMWPLLKETVDEWEAEAGFSWDDLAYISLDSTVTDQFVAIRQDRTWAGSVNDESEEALESFALNFFSRARSKKKSRPNGNQQPNRSPKPTDTVPDGAAQASYEKWAIDVASAFASALVALGANGGKAKGPKKLEIRSRGSQASIPTAVNGDAQGKLLSQFPYLPAPIVVCKLDDCAPLKADSAGLRACRHDVERLFRASGLYSYEWLRQERIRWHPDRFGRLCDEQWRDTGRKLSEEMFKVIDGLMSDLGGASVAE